MRRHLYITFLLLLAGIGAGAYDGYDSTEIRTEAAEMVVPDTMVPSDAPKKRFFLLRLMDKALDVDTNYIEQPKYNITLMTEADWRFKYIWLRGSDDEGHHQTLYFHPHSQVTIGPYVGYSMLFFGWTVDIGSRLTTNNSNIYLSLYAPMFGIDYYYENDINGYNISRLSGFSDDVKERSVGMDFPGLSTDMK